MTFDLRADRAHGCCRDDGFSIVEVLFSTAILSVVLLGLVGVISVGVKRVVDGSPALTAREKAREAIESVHTARDTGALSWTKIRNVSAGGVFLNGPQPLERVGADGLVNTVDDDVIETVVGPGPDGRFNTADDTQTPLNNFTREIVIADLLLNGGAAINPNLREVIVTVRYRVQNMWRAYTLRTYVSSFS